MNTGYLPHKTVKGIVFYIIATCIILSTAAGMLLTWGSIGEAIAYKLFSSTGVLALGSLTFLLINYIFGNLEQTLFAPRNNQTMPTDPAFADRLAKAKAMRGPDKTDSDQESKVG